MEIDFLRDIAEDWSCGKRHRCDVKKVLIEKNAITKLASLLSGYRHILLIADENTYSACGERVYGTLKDWVDAKLIYPGPELLVPDEKAIELLNRRVSETTDFILGIGSGVINDLCKYVSFQRGLPYGIVATAPSMDGFASVGAAMIVGGMKVTYTAHAPIIIAGDLDVLKEAPVDMIRSGYGDIIGKYSALNDWELSRIVNDEYFCTEIFDMVLGAIEKVKPIGKRIFQRREEDIKILMEALVLVGTAMSYAGNSRPASGSEHHLSHFFEVVGLIKKEPYFFHGIDVAYSSLATQRLREKILTLNSPGKPEPFRPEQWEKSIRDIYSKAAPGVIHLQNSLGWYHQDRFPVYARHWDEIKAVLKKAPSSPEIEKVLEEAGLFYSDFEKQYGMVKIQTAIWFAKDLKDRYTVLWLYHDLFDREID